MFRRVWGAVAALCLGCPALAGPVEEMRGHIVAGDTAAAEVQMRGLHEGWTERGESGALRAINGALFTTTDPQTIAFLLAWSEAEPDSPYAQAAWFWNRLHIAFLHRGTKPAGQTSDPAMQAHRRELAAARAAGMAAFTSAPDYLPAAEAALSLAASRGGAVDVGAVLATIFATRPEQHSLDLAVRAASPEWGGSIERMLALCEEYAGRIDGYDPELCAIRAVLTHRAPPGLRNEAERLLCERDDEMLDVFRLRYPAILNPCPAWDANTLVEKHRIGLELGVPPQTYMQNADLVAMNTDNEFYRLEARERMHAWAMAALEADPFNPDLVVWALETRKPVRRADDPDGRDLAQAQALWRRALFHGGDRPEIWALGMWMVATEAPGAPRGALIAPYLENAAALDPLPAGHVARLLEAYGSDHFWAERVKDGKPVKRDMGPGYDPDAVIAEVECPMLRAARLYEAYCALDRGEMACDPSIGTEKNAREILDNETLIAACPDVAFASLHDLRYRFTALAGAGE